jgi:hypothetical protein
MNRLAADTMKLLATLSVFVLAVSAETLTANAEKGVLATITPAAKIARRDLPQSTWGFWLDIVTPGKRMLHSRSVLLETLS